MKDLFYRYILFSLFTYLLGGTAFSQDQVNISKKINLIDSLVNSASFESALEEIESTKLAITNTSIEKVDSLQLYFSTKLSFVYGQLKKYDKAISSTKQAILFQDSISGRKGLAYYQLLRSLGVYYINSDSLIKADSTLSTLLESHKRNIRVFDEISILSMDDLAFVKSKRGKIGDAVSLYRELLKVLKNNKSEFYFNIMDSYTTLLINNELYEESIPYFESLDKWYQGKSGYSQFLKDYHNVFIYAKDYVNVYRTARDLIKLNSDSIYAEIKINAARAAYLMNKLDSALAFYDKAYQAFDDSIQAKIQIHLERTDVYNARNQNYQMIRELQYSRNIHESYALTDSGSYTQTILLLGTIYTEIGEFELAGKLFGDYISALESKGEVDYLKVAQAYQSLGNQKYLLRDFEGADYNLNRSEMILSDNNLKSETEYASCLNSLGALKEALADYDKAKKYYEQAFSIAKNEDNVSLKLKIASASNLANIINAFNPQNDSINILYTQAIQWQTDLTGENHPDFANLLNKRGLAYQKIQAFDLAEKDYLQAKKVLEYTVGNSHPEYLVALSNLGLLYSTKGENESALDIMLETIALYKKYYSSDHPGYILTINNLANLYTKVEDYSKAEQFFLLLADYQLKEITESFSYLSENEKKTFVEEKKKFMENLKKYIISRYFLANGSLNPQILSKWFELELNIKGILLNSTKKVRAQIFESGDEGLIQLFSNWTLAREQVAELQSLKSDRSIQSKNQLDSLIQRIDVLEKEISRASYGFGNSYATSNVTFDQVRNSLSPGECSIEIVRVEFEDKIKYVALYVESDLSNPELIVIGDGEEMEQRGFNSYKNLIKFSVANGGPFTTYWKPLQDRIDQSEITTIFFTPDGIYHKISAVTIYNERDKSYLIDNYDFIQLTSSKDILHLKSNTNQSVDNKQLMLIGRPNYTLGVKNESSSFQASRSFTMDNIVDLPGTEQEVNGINDALIGKDIEIKKYLGDESSEVNFKSNLDSDIIHIATHGFFFDEKQVVDENYIDPMLYSGLLLAGVSDKDIKQKTGEDWILTAYEIMNLGFNNLDMVVLSACETGTGQISSGEGVYGLQRAFFVAGANTLIMSLWKVDDLATKDLMTSFYKGVVKGKSKREAFIAAQKKVKKKYKSPVYWGSFVMVGG